MLFMDEKHDTHTLMESCWCGEPWAKKGLKVSIKGWTKMTKNGPKRLKKKGSECCLLTKNMIRIH